MFAGNQNLINLEVKTMFTLDTESLAIVEAFVNEFYPCVEKLDLDTYSLVDFCAECFPADNVRVNELTRAMGIITNSIYVQPLPDESDVYVKYSDVYEKFGRVYQIITTKLSALEAVGQNWYALERAKELVVFYMGAIKCIILNK